MNVHLSAVCVVNWAARQRWGVTSPHPRGIGWALAKADRKETLGMAGNQGGLEAIRVQVLRLQVQLWGSHNKALVQSFL